MERLIPTLECDGWILPHNTVELPLKCDPPRDDPRINKVAHYFQYLIRMLKIQCSMSAIMSDFQPSEDLPLPLDETLVYPEHARDPDPTRLSFKALTFGGEVDTIDLFVSVDVGNGPSRPWLELDARL